MVKLSEKLARLFPGDFTVGDVYWILQFSNKHVTDLEHVAIDNIDPKELFMFYKHTKDVLVFWDFSRKKFINLNLKSPYDRPLAVKISP